MNLRFEKNVGMLRRAFTLAEVLITLGVIGIVAAMTIPTLMNQTSDKETVTKVKKVYSTLSNAATLVKLDEGGDLSGLISVGNTGVDIFNAFAPHLKTIKNCGEDYSECWYPISEQRALRGTIITHYLYVPGGDYNQAGYNTLILTDGTLVSFSPAISGTSYTDGDYSAVTVDINGKKQPNQYGFDVFRFFIDKNGTHPWGQNYPDSRILTNDTFYEDCAQTSGLTCAIRILRENAINYTRGTATAEEES